MSEWTSFEDLDFSENDVDSGERRLKPGRYECEILSAEVSTNNDGKGKALKLEFRDTEGSGTISTFINIFLPGKPKGEKIGRDKVKSMLTHAGHPSPDKPGAVSTMVGLKVGVNVESSEWTDSNGESRNGSQVADWHPFFDATDAVGLGAIELPIPSTKKNGSAEKPTFDDDIPF